ncbi:rod shape-determining protein RodA [Planotetraspora thailandica]|uniref:peptidoglycan glycosyltransferase n=1 Tax=Planotetraspora thailandica TaxID=487172 RepID=A0A8J3VE97_9ACTN|nr:rod shape-determining protein RodA [Planotetraspora thailandica]GII56460.1 rod shape-determining protein RodA [Planotetraspora thailandica]
MTTRRVLASPTRVLASPARGLPYTKRSAPDAAWSPPFTSAAPGDRWLLVTSLALAGIGLLLVASATRAGSGSVFLQRHATGLCLGLALMWIVSRCDPRGLKAYVPAVYLLALAGLVAVLTPLGRTVNGSQAWLALGDVLRFQPSEFAKVAMILTLATVLGSRRGNGRPGDGQVLAALALTAPPVALILLEPDAGTALVFAAITVGMITLSGARLRWFAGLAAAGALAAALIWHFGLLRPYQLLRLSVLLSPDADPLGAGYHATQSRIAVGSGEVFGTGLFQGGQTAGGFVPEQHTDFIFTVAGEELGFLGSAAIVLLVTLLLLRGLRIAARTPSPYGTALAGGVVCWLAFQSFVNLGMTLGLLPITGLPLPLVSYGGSATVAVLGAVGLLDAVNRTGWDGR